MDEFDMAGLCAVPVLSPRWGFVVFTAGPTADAGGLHSDAAPRLTPSGYILVPLKRR